MVFLNTIPCPIGYFSVIMISNKAYNKKAVTSQAPTLAADTSHSSLHSGKTSRPKSPLKVGTRPGDRVVMAICIHPNKKPKEKFRSPETSVWEQPIEDEEDGDEEYRGEWIKAMLRARSLDGLLFEERLELQLRQKRNKEKKEKETK